MVFRFEDRVVVRNKNALPALFVLTQDGSEATPFGKFYFRERPADHLRIFFAAVSNDLYRFGNAVAQRIGCRDVAAANEANEFIECGLSLRNGDVDF